MTTIDNSVRNQLAPFDGVGWPYSQTNAIADTQTKYTSNRALFKLIMVVCMLLASAAWALIMYQRQYVSPFNLIVAPVNQTMAVLHLQLLKSGNSRSNTNTNTNTRGDKSDPLSHSQILTRSEATDTVDATAIASLEFIPVIEHRVNVGKGSELKRNSPEEKQFTASELLSSSLENAPKTNIKREESRSGGATLFDARLRQKLAASAIARRDRQPAKSAETFEEYRSVTGDEVRRVGDVCGTNNRVMAQQMDVDSMYFYRTCKQRNSTIEFKFKPFF